MSQSVNTLVWTCWFSTEKQTCCFWQNFVLITLFLNWVPLNILNDDPFILTNSPFKQEIVSLLTYKFLSNKANNSTSTVHSPQQRLSLHTGTPASKHEELMETVMSLPKYYGVLLTPQYGKKEGYADFEIFSYILHGFMILLLSQPRFIAQLSCR